MPEKIFVPENSKIYYRKYPRVEITSHRAQLNNATEQQHYSR